MKRRRSNRGFDGGVRPRTRGECQGGVRPCPFVSCRYHLFLDIDEETREIHLNYPGKEIFELENTCSLDIAEKGEVPLPEVARILNVGQKAVRNLVSRSLATVRARAMPLELVETDSPGSTQDRKPVDPIHA